MYLTIPKLVTRTVNRFPNRPFQKTSTMNIKRHLYKGGNHVSNDQ